MWCTGLCAVAVFASVTIGLAIGFSTVGASTHCLPHVGTVCVPGPCRALHAQLKYTWLMYVLVGLLQRRLVRIALKSWLGGQLPCQMGQLGPCEPQLLTASSAAGDSAGAVVYHVPLGIKEGSPIAPLSWHTLCAQLALIAPTQLPLTY